MQVRRWRSGLHVATALAAKGIGNQPETMLRLIWHFVFWPLIVVLLWGSSLLVIGLVANAGLSPALIARALRGVWQSGDARRDLVAIVLVLGVLMAIIKAIQFIMLWRAARASRVSLSKLFREQRAGAKD